MANASGDDEEKTIDMISDLSDDILRHILSFLLTNYSVRTIFVSKRFHNLWTSLPVLNVIDMLCPAGVEKFLEKALSSHADLSMVRKLRLMCFDCVYNRTKIPNWIESAIARLSNLEDLDIYVHPNYRVSLPSTVFSCPRLKTLRLEGGIIDINIPAGVFHPCLKTFEFKSLSIVADNLSNMFLYAICPVLENFLIQDCSLEILGNNITILPVRLEYLRGLLGDLDSASLNVKVLKHLELHDTSVSPFVVSLRFLARIHRSAGRGGNYRPIFPHLTHVVAKVLCLSDLCDLLEQSPNLISLVLEKVECKCWDDLIVSRSLCKNLETVQFNDFEGFQEMKFVKYLLKNAEVLKNLVLSVARAVRLSNETKASILHEIRVLSQCEVEFRD